MKRSRVAEIFGLAGLVGLLSLNDAHAEGKFSISGSIGGYSPFGDVVALEGIPYGAEIEGDYGSNKIGFRGGFGWFTKIGDQRVEFGLLSKNIVEGERERAEIARFYGGLRLGNPWFYVGAGGVAIEGRNIFETADRKFLRQEFRQFVDRKSLHGVYGEFSVGAPIKKSKKAGVFFKGTYDHFFDEDKSRGVKFSAGITFSP